MKASYIHRGVTFGNVHVARWATLLSEIDVAWNYTPGTAADFVLPARGFALRLAKNLDPMPTLAEVIALGLPIGCVPRVRMASNLVRVVTLDGMAQRYLLDVEDVWPPEFVEPWLAARDAFQKVVAPVY